jgi:hypothetical protein
MRLTARVATGRALPGLGSLSLVLSAFASIAAADTNGTCVYTPLTSGVTQTVSVDMNYPFNQTNSYWTAIGIRPASTEDWDMNVFDAAGVDPECVTGELALSGQGTGKVDVIVGDFNHNETRTYFAHAYLFEGTHPATIEWDAGADVLEVNDYATFRTTGSNDVLECFDVFLEAGKTYSVTLTATGQASMNLYLFHNPVSADYWATFLDAVLEVVASPEGTAGSYTPIESDWYGIVVVNQNGESGEYDVRVSTCDPAVALAENVPQVALGNAAPFAFTPSSVAWAAAGVHTSNPAQDWDLSLWHDYAAGGASPCLSGEYATSKHGFGKADIVAIDFNHSPLEPVYARAYPTGQTNTASTVQWDDGPDQYVLGTNVTRSTGPGDIVRIWDVHLTLGFVYQVEISSFATVGGQPAPKCAALLFRNHNGAAPYAAGRQDADLETRTFAPYAPPITTDYGLAVVNDNGATGQYTVKVSQATMVDASPPGAEAFVTRLVSLSPNPVTAGAATRIAFELAKPGRVGFELVDVAGRVRRRLDPVAFAAGPAITTWALRGKAVESAGAASGVYFLRMSVDGRPAGSTRLVLLEGGVN